MSGIYIKNLPILITEIFIYGFLILRIHTLKRGVNMPIPKKHTTTLLAVLALFFLLYQPYQGLGLQSNSNLTINVNVTEKTIVDIQPKALSWVGVEPGTENSTTTSGISTVTIENLGSTNITKVWFSNSYPHSRPFGTADPNAYDPGNFVVITNSSYSTGGGTSLPYYFINRVEYPEPYHDFVKVPIQCETPTYCFKSRFRNASKEYFFIVDNSSTGRCDDTAQLRISSKPRVTQSSSTEIVDLSAEPPIPLQYVGVVASGPWAGNWSATEVVVNGTDRYCFVVTTNCSMAIFARFNADIPGITSVCTSIPSYWVNGTTIVPGEWREAGIRVRVPYGTVAGQLPPGRLTVYVSDT